ncbi:MAG: hypothetical protein QJR13_06635 [Bacillota bacterium]|nr:hypothetical protein [Bacillota bacterium]
MAGQGGAESKSGRRGFPQPPESLRPQRLGRLAQRWLSLFLRLRPAAAVAVAALSLCLALPSVHAAAAGAPAGSAAGPRSGPVAQARPGPFAEVASGHWTYLDLSVLSSADLLQQRPSLLTSGYTLTRFEVALLLSEALDRVLTERGEGRTAEEGNSSGPVLVVRDGKTFPLNLKPAVIGALGRLLREYWPELEMLGWRMGEIPLQVPPTFRFCDLDEVTEAEVPSPEQHLQLYPMGVPLDRLSLAWEEPPEGQGAPGGVVILRQTRFGGQPDHYFYLLGNEPSFDPRLQLPLSLENQKMALVSGEFQVSEDLKISGEVVHPAAPSDQKGGAARVGAAVNLGQVEVGADLHRVESGSAPLLPAEEGSSASTGYGFFLRFGRVTVRTGLELLKPPGDARAGLGAEAGSAAGAGTPGWTAAAAPGKSAPATGEVRLVDLDRVTVGESKPQGASTTLGVDVQLTQQASVQAGISITKPLENAGGGSGDSPFLRFDGKKATAGLKLRLSNGAVLAANLGYAQKELTGGRETSTSVGVSYSLSPGASLLFNYRLINFGPEGAVTSQAAESAATAEIALHF